MALYVGNTRYTPILGNSRASFMVEDTLPYDAEIEYLEAVSGCKIVTDIYFDSTTEYTCTFYFGNITARTLFSGIFGGNMDGYWAITSNGYVEKNYNNPSAVNVRNGLHTFVRALNVKTCDGVSIEKNAQADSGWFNHPTYPLTFFAYQHDQNGNSANTRFVSAIVKKNNVIVADYIPVRKGSVGYLYDRVSKQLFGNSGTGDFVLGQDIVEVEYLESSGAPYIDTGVYITKSTNVEISHQVIALYADASADITYFSCWTSNNQCAYCFRTGSNTIRTRWGSSSYTDLAVSKNDMILFTVDGTKYINKNVTKNTTKSANTGSSYPTNQTFRLFAGTENRPVRIYYAKVDNLDLIPVRVGQTGYMYDKVSRKLFGNAGTGSFILGNDKN